MQQVEILKQNLLTMDPRNFGEKFGEAIFMELFPELEPSAVASHDADLAGSRVEIKISRAKKPKKKEGLFENLLVRTGSSFVCHAASEKYDCNIQQVKPKYFDLIYYGVFFEDGLYLFRATSEDIVSDPAVRYSDKQHRGNKGEGQFHINSKTLPHHMDKFFIRSVDWQEILKIVKKNQKNA